MSLQEADDERSLIARSFAQIMKTLAPTDKVLDRNIESPVRKLDVAVADLVPVIACATGRERASAQSPNPGWRRSAAGADHPGT